MTSASDARIDGHLKFVTETGDRKALSTYTFEAIETRARPGLRRWFKITPHEAVLTNPHGFDSTEELEADIRDFLAILHMDSTHVEGRINVTPNNCESITYTLTGNDLAVHHTRCD